MADAILPHQKFFWWGPRIFRLHVSACRTGAKNSLFRRSAPYDSRRERQITAARSAQARPSPGTPDHGGKVRASENAAGNARSRRQGPRKRERRRERQKNPLLQAGFPLRYGGTLTLWLTLAYPTKNSFCGGPGLMPLITCVLRNKCGKFAVPLLSAGLTVAVYHAQTVIYSKSRIKRNSTVWGCGGIIPPQSAGLTITAVRHT